MLPAMYLLYQYAFFFCVVYSQSNWAEGNKGDKVNMIEVKAN